MNIIAILLARGGSKGIPKKNIKLFCGKPLIAWTIEQVKNSSYVNSLWVSSDDDDILSIAKEYGANEIIRPKELSDDKATSESGWLHAIEYIEKSGEKADLVIGVQATSPLRETMDIDKGIEIFLKEGFDSLFSGAKLEDFLIWKKDSKNKLKSLNYDYRQRKRRQDNMSQYMENGSFYVFKPEALRKYNNRLGGKIGISIMELWKSFELDSLEDWRMCEVLMQAFLLKK